MDMKVLRIFSQPLRLKLQKLINMQLDLNKYRVNKLFILTQYQKTKDRYSISDILSMASSTTHCPLLALNFYLSESIGYIPELIVIIDRLIAFYGYTEILGQSPDSPYLTMDTNHDINKP
jgi:hypothetical protein